MANEHANKSAVLLIESAGPIDSIADIRVHLEVCASCGTKIGKVDHVEGDSIKLAKHDSPDGQHHTTSLEWVAKVHEHFHLSKNHEEVPLDWRLS
ncbi:DUF2171 domain-containing protein [Singulisphaera sp. Ch08]|uniref:DUF2171 domain-containing protein n=1 Tax=Singulisphaera sp. Ch08 TaxID=3120278 RepID=A0AAU7CLU7_9BACT